MFAGASNGINKNFETVQEVLGDFVSVHDAGKEPAAVKVPALCYPFAHCAVALAQTRDPFCLPKDAVAMFPLCSEQLRRDKGSIVIV